MDEGVAVAHRLSHHYKTDGELKEKVAVVGGLCYHGENGEEVVVANILYHHCKNGGEAHRVLSAWVCHLEQAPDNVPKSTMHCLDGDDRFLGRQMDEHLSPNVVLHCMS